MTINPLDLARHLGRMRRRFIECQPRLVLRDVPGGFACVYPEGESGEFPSTGKDRVCWLAPEVEIGSVEIEAGLALAREHGRKRVFLWAPPWAVTEWTEAALRAAGAEPVEFVRQLALAREGPPPDEPATGQGALVMRRVEREAAPTVLDAARPWYGNWAVESVLGVVNGLGSELFSAFDGERPVAAGVLTLDGKWAYISSAVTDPAWRGRGAQKALIRARVRRAAELGAKWCSCETNTAVEISLNNLRAYGFAPLITWRVFKWEASREG